MGSKKWLKNQKKIVESINAYALNIYLKFCETEIIHESACCWLMFRDLLAQLRIFFVNGSICKCSTLSQK